MWGTWCRLGRADSGFLCQQESKPIILKILILYYDLFLAFEKTRQNTICQNFDLTGKFEKQQPVYFSRENTAFKFSKTWPTRQIFEHKKNRITIRQKFKYLPIEDRFDPDFRHIRSRIVQLLSRYFRVGVSKRHLELELSPTEILVKRKRETMPKQNKWTCGLSPV